MTKRARRPITLIHLLECGADTKNLLTAAGALGIGHTTLDRAYVLIDKILDDPESEFTASYLDRYRDACLEAAARLRETA